MKDWIIGYVFLTILPGIFIYFISVMPMEGVKADDTRTIIIKTLCWLFWPLSLTYFIAYGLAKMMAIVINKK